MLFLCIVIYGVSRAVESLCSPSQAGLAVPGDAAQGGWDPCRLQSCRNACQRVVGAAAAFHPGEGCKSSS